MAVEGTYFRPFGRVVNSLSGIFDALNCKSRGFSNTSTTKRKIHLFFDGKKSKMKVKLFLVNQREKKYLQPFYLC